jgi:N-acetylglucosaminyldiphosphoundecaprenol N-acetyl-beta-D-mannosaminyltransferase
MRKLQIIAGVPIDDLTMQEALERIETFIASRRPHQVVTVNADFVARAWDDPELRYILQVADMLTPDGIPLVWGARLLGVPLEGRVTGADMVPALAERGAQKGWRFVFVGARPGVAARAARVLEERFPGLQVADTYSPPLSTVVEMDPDVVARIRRSQPDILLVAFGNPKQEKWIHMHLAELNVPVSIGVGGTFDFIAGETRCAPPWMQKAGLEWLFRLIQEPDRLWRRYMVDLVHFGHFFLRQWWMQRRGQSMPPIVPRAQEAAETPGGKAAGSNLLAVGGTLTAANREELVARVEQVLEHAPRLVLDMTATTFVDSAGMGTLVDLTRRARAAGGDVRLAGVRPQVRRTMELLNLDRFLAMDDTVQAGRDALAAASAPAPSEPRTVGRWTVLDMPARLDVQVAAEVRARGERVLAEVVRAPANAVYPRLMVDLSRTEYVDSAGIAALLALHRQAQEWGGELRLAGVTPTIWRTIELAGVASILTRADTVHPADTVRPGDDPDTA